MTAYVFAELQVTDKSVCKEQYVPVALQAVDLYGGRFVSTGRRVLPHRGACAVREGCATTFKYVMLGEDGDSSTSG